MSFDNLPCGWKLVALEDAMDAIIDYRGKTPKKTESGIPLITAKIVKGGYVLEPFEFIAEENYDSWMVRGLPQVGDIVLTTEAPLGETAQLTSSNVALAQRIVTLRGKKELLDNDFLLCALQSNFVQHQLESRASGSTVKGIKQSELRKVSLPIPPLVQQKKIAQILKSLSNKLVSNTQTNQTLEQMAQAIFKSWFVDFDPVKAKIEALASGKSQADAELAAMAVISAKTLDELTAWKTSNPQDYAKLAQTAALFPSAMVDSELGQIPLGWEVSDLTSCTTELRRGISPKYIEEGGVLVINQKCIRNHTVDFSLARRNDPAKRKVDGREIAIGDVLVNSTGVGTLGRLAPIRFLNETTVVDSHVTVVRANTTKISKSFLAGLMLTNEAYIESSGGGSTGQTELRKQVLEAIKFAKPLNAVDKLFDEIVGKFNAQVAELEKQKVTLSLTRNALLPKLLSGELVGE